MKVLYNKNDEKNECIDGIQICAYDGKRMDFLLAGTLPTELSRLTTNSFQNHT